MQFRGGNSRRIVISVLSLLCLGTSLLARVQNPVASAYEDSVRILVIYNLGATLPQTGCSGVPAAGTATMQFVVGAIDSTYVNNVKVTTAHNSTVTSVQGAFGSQLPHVLVHVNGGWGSTSGNNIKAILQWALDNNVGVVEVGDDDMLNLAPEFTPWVYIIDMWGPMVTGLWATDPGDSLYIRMSPGADNLCDSSAYPNLSGIVRNAAAIAGDTTIQFKAAGIGASGRCEADPDVIGFTAGSQDKVAFLAYQQGYEDSAAAYIGNPWDYCVVTVLQDSLELVDGWAMRRAVSLSMQPQYLDNTAAMEQLTYDAIMYASMVHLVNPPTPFTGTRNPRVRPAQASAARIPAGAFVRIADTGGRVVYAGTGAPRTSMRSLRPGVYVMTVMSSGVTRSMPFVAGR